MKVIVCIMSSCSIRVGAWNYLKVKHITAIKKGDVTLAWMKVYAGQNVGKRREYPTLITPEAYHAFQEYLASRTAAGERVTAESWIVRDKWQTTNVRRRGGNYGLGTIPKQLKANGLKSDIDDALWRVGIRVTSAKHHEFKECHGFRKFFKTYAQRTMKETNVERLLGHAGRKNAEKDIGELTAVVNTWNARGSGIASLSHNNGNYGGGKKLDTELISS